MWKFLKTEMQVIYALTEDAERTDSEIADLFDLKKGTVSSARRRLLDAGAIHFAYVPEFNRLGCEMLGYHYGTTDPALRPDTKANHYMEFCSRASQIYHSLIGGNSVAMFTALRNATDFESFVQEHNAFFSGPRRESRAKLAHVVFPYALSRVTQTPQFAWTVGNFFGFDTKPLGKTGVTSVSSEHADLNSTDRKVLPALVANPMASDREIASEVNLSRQAVARMRKKYKDEGLLRRICIPRLYRWGFEICAIAHPRFAVDFGYEKRLKSEPRGVIERSCYVLSKADESVGIYMVPKFSEYSEGLEDMMAWYHKVGAFEEDPDVLLFSLERTTELRTFDYYHAVNRLLQFDAHAA